MRRDSETLHCTTSVRITNSRTLPPERVAARSLRSWRMFCESDRAFELLQRQGPQIGEDVVAELAPATASGWGMAFGSKTIEPSRRIQVSCGAPRLVTIGGRS